MLVRVRREGADVWGKLGLPVGVSASGVGGKAAEIKHGLLPGYV